MVRYGKLRWFGHVKRKNGDDWVSACKIVLVAGVETWRECEKMKRMSLACTLMGSVQGMWRGLILGKMSNPS